MDTITLPSAHALHGSRDTSVLLRSGLNMIQQALTIYSEDLRLIFANRRFGFMFDLPDRFSQPGATFEETLEFLTARGEYGPVGDLKTYIEARLEQARAFEPHYVERQRPDGSWISVEGGPLRQGGWVTVYTDISQIKEQEALWRARSDELSDDLLDRSEELARTNRALEATINRLHETQQHLEAAEARVRLAAETTPAHIARLNRSEVYTYSNRRLPLMAANGSDDIIGHTARAILGDSIYETITPALQSAYAGEPKVVEFEVPEDGRKIRAAFTPDADATDTVRGVYVLSMDISLSDSGLQPATQDMSVATFHGWVANLRSLQLIAPDGRATQLSMSEAELLSRFLSRPNDVLSREDLVQSDADGASRRLDVRISRLRKKLGDDPRSPQMLRTVYGAGYIFVGDVHWQ